jgi:hypothetical protein
MRTRPDDSSPPPIRGERLRSDQRGITPAVGKALEVGVVVLFVGVLTTTLYGNAVPEYRDTVGDEVADRTVAAAAERVENAVPPRVRRARVVHRVDLPERIRGASYRIAAVNRSLVVHHPSRAVEARTRLALPAHVDAVVGEWESGAETVVVVSGTNGGVTVRLTDQDRLEGGPS